VRFAGRYFVFLIFMLWQGIGATPVLAHALHGPERHEVRLEVIGDRVAVEYKVVALDAAAAAASASDETVDQRAGMLLGLQRVRIDERPAPLELRDVNVAADGAVFRFDTGEKSLTAGEHEVSYLALTGPVAKEFSLHYEAGAGVRMVGEARAPGRFRWEARVAVDGETPLGQRLPLAKIGGLWSRLTERVRTGQGARFWMTIMGISLLLGMMHAVTPGHGKSLAAAYLIGKQGGARDAAIFAGSVTVTHTVLVFVLALFAVFAGGLINQAVLGPWLQLAGGLAMIAVGLWLLKIRLAEHSHEPGADGGHHHPHSHHHHDHDHGAAGWRGAVLGAAAGAAPCPEALALLFMAISAGRPAAGLVMLAAFFVGLAGVLFLVGIAVMNAGPLLARLLRRDVGSVARRLSIVSAVLIVLIGALFVYGASRVI
jgi:nickel/cobalt transporter (NicO) family protein